MIGPRARPRRRSRGRRASTPTHTVRKRARARARRGTPASSRSSFATLLRVAGARAREARRCTPGAPPSASTSRPVSSAIAGSPVQLERGARLDARVLERAWRRSRRARVAPRSSASATSSTPVAAQQRAQLAHLVAIERGEDELSCRPAAARALTRRARSPAAGPSRRAAGADARDTRRMPRRASRSSARSSASLNVALSPVPCTSTKRPRAGHHHVHVHLRASSPRRSRGRGTARPRPCRPRSPPRCRAAAGR